MPSFNPYLYTMKQTQKTKAMKTSAVELTSIILKRGIVITKSNNERAIAGGLAAGIYQTNKWKDMRFVELKCDLHNINLALISDLINI